MLIRTRIVRYGSVCPHNDIGSVPPFGQPCAMMLEVSRFLSNAPCISRPRRSIQGISASDIPWYLRARHFARSSDSSVHMASATGSHCSARYLHFPQRCCMSSGDSMSVECTPLFSIMSIKHSGFSSIGHGLSRLSLNCWLSWFAMNRGRCRASSNVISRMFESA